MGKDTIRIDVLGEMFLPFQGRDASEKWPDDEVHRRYDSKARRSARKGALADISCNGRIMPSKKICTQRKIREACKDKRALSRC